MSKIRTDLTLRIVTFTDNMCLPQKTFYTQNTGFLNHVYSTGNSSILTFRTWIPAAKTPSVEPWISSWPLLWAALGNRWVQRGARMLGGTLLRKPEAWARGFPPTLLLSLCCRGLWSVDGEYMLAVHSSLLAILSYLKQGFNCWRQNLIFKLFSDVSMQWNFSREILTCLPFVWVCKHQTL